MRKKPIFIIAEAGVNHNGNIDYAKELVDAAKEAGADAVKFQTFKPEALVSKHAQKAEYQKKTTGNQESQLDMIRKLTLTYEEFIELSKYCEKKEILFLSTPFDNDSIDFLDSLRMPVWKVPSGEITNVPYLIKLAMTGKPIIMSTGMCDMDEIVFAVDIMKKQGAGDITILQCNTQYPTPYEDANLNAMLTIKDYFHTEIGYSDHTLGIEVPIAAAALGARVIEKHFTLNKNWPGPDHKVSLDPEELKAMVQAIRNIEAAMGSGMKEPTPSEQKNIEIARKSIVAKYDIKAGEVFTEDNLTVKRPGSGISPVKWFEVMGRTAKKDFSEDDLIEL